MRNCLYVKTIEIIFFYLLDCFKNLEKINKIKFKVSHINNFMKCFKAGLEL